jgi:hypothetical protein
MVILDGLARALLYVTTRFLWSACSTFWCKEFVMIGKIGKLLATAGICLMAMGAQAATVQCTTVGGERYLEVTNAADPGACFAGIGNITALGNGGSAGIGDYLGGNLSYLGSDTGEVPVTGKGGITGSTSGGWWLADDAWSINADLFLVLKFGQGSADPDWFVVELENGKTSGQWDLLPAKLANGVSHWYVVGTACTALAPCEPQPPCTVNCEPPCTVNCEPPPCTPGVNCTTTELPLPGSVPLVGLALGLLGFASYQRRNQQKH